MNINSTIKQSASEKDFISMVLAIHKEAARKIFTQFSSRFAYKNDSDNLLAFQEIEYFAFWLFRLHIKDSILSALYTAFLKGGKESIDTLQGHLEMRYKIYDGIFNEFTKETNKADPAAAGLRLGQAIIKIIGNLELMKSGCLDDNQDKNVEKIFMASYIWCEHIKIIDGLFKECRQEFEIGPFLKNQS